MTTDDVKRTIDKWHQKRNTWPTKGELEMALVTEGFTVDSLVLNDLVDMLQTNDAIHIINGTFVI